MLLQITSNKIDTLIFKPMKKSLTGKPLFVFLKLYSFCIVKNLKKVKTKQNRLLSEINLPNLNYGV
jgi:hypothetical protein